MATGRNSPLHCWDFPTSSSPTPGPQSSPLLSEGILRPCRPASGRPHPRCGFARDRVRVLQRLRTSQHAKSQPPTMGGVVEQTSDQPGSQVVGNVALSFDAKDRFYGASSGVEIEAELNRIASLMRTLMHDFAAVKPLIKNQEAERQQVLERVTSFEQGDFTKVLGHVEINNGRILGLVGQAEMMEARLDAAESKEASPMQMQVNLQNLGKRMDVLEKRVTFSEQASNNAAKALAAAAAGLPPVLPELPVSVPTPMLPEPPEAAFDAESFTDGVTNEVVSGPGTPQARLYSEVRDLAHGYVHGAATPLRGFDDDLKELDDDLGQATLSQVELLKRNLGDGDAVRICILGGTLESGSSCDEVVEAIAKDFAVCLGAETNASFIIRGEDEWQRGFEKHCADRVWSLLPHGESSSRASRCTIVHAGANSRDRDAIFAQLGDAYVLVGGNENAAQIARAADRRGCFVLPVVRAGGAATGIFGLPSRILRSPSFVGSDARWALLADESARVEDSAAAVAVIMRAFIDHT